MTDIIERSLNLRVQGENLASDVFMSLGDQILELEQRTQTAFAGMASYAQDASSVIAEAAQEFAPVWISQFEALESAASGTFEALAADAALLSDSAGLLADSMGRAALSVGALVSEASGAVGVLDTLTGSADGVASGLADITASGGEADAVLSALSGDASAAAGALDEIMGSADAATVLGDIAKTGADASLALSDLGAEANAANGSLSLIAADADAATVLGDVAKQAGAADTALAALAPDAKAANGSLDLIAGAADAATVLGDVAKGAADADTALADLGAGAKAASTSLDGIAADAEAATVLGDIAKNAGAADDALAALGPDAKKAAEAITTSFSADALDSKGPAGKFAASWDGAFTEITAAARTSALEVDAAYGITPSGAALKGAQADAAAVGGTAGAGERAALTAAERDAVSAGSSGGMLGRAAGGLTGGVMSGGLLAGIAAMMTLGGTSMSIGGVQGIGNLAAQTGESPTQALKLEMESVAQGTNANLEKIDARLVANLNKVQQQTGVIDQGSYVNLGYGRGAVDPATIEAVTKGGQKGVEAALSELYGSGAAAATQLMNLTTSERMQSIADKLETIKNQNERVAITAALYGARGVTQILPMLENFAADSARASKDIAGAGGTTTALNKTLDPQGQAGMANYQMELKLAEVGMEVGLAQLAPTLTILTKTIVSLESWLEKELGPGGTIHKAASHALSTVEHPIAGIQGKFSTDTTPQAIAAGITNIAQAQLFATMDKAFGGTLKTLAQAESIKADILAAAKYGLNPMGLVASQKNESGWIPNRYEGSSPSDPTKGSSAGTGLAQFAPSTWVSDYRSTFGKAPTNDLAANYSPTIQAEVEAHTLKSHNLDLAGTNSMTGASQIIDKFELPKSTTADLQAASQFLSEIVNHAKTLAPEIPKATNLALEQMIAGALTHSKEFPPKIDVMLAVAEGFLKTAEPRWGTLGTSLIKGLEKGLTDEAPMLQGEAKKIADDLEATFKQALKIHSPSEMTAEMGANLMQGLAVGMHRETPSTVVAAAGAALRVGGALAPGVTGGGGAGGAPQMMTVIFQLGREEIGRAASEYIHGRTLLVGRIN